MQPGANTYDVTHASVPAQTAAEVAARPASWQAYTYVQDTLDRSGDREANDRIGVGAQKQVNDHVRLGSEISEGSGGFGGQLTGDYRIDDRSNVYLAHSIVTERDDSTYQGRFNNTVVGSRIKLSDQVSVYDEARDGHGAGPQSATNAFGVDLAPNDRWNYGVKWETGTISDPVAGDLTRHAVSVSTGYKEKAIRFASSLEFRHENGTAGERDTWLSRNAGSYQVSPDWRLMAKPISPSAARARAISTTAILSTPRWEAPSAPSPTIAGIRCFNIGITTHCLHLDRWDSLTTRWITLSVVT